jgi:hypothetical protein
LVEAGRHHEALDDHGPHRLVQRAVAAADLDRRVHSAARPLPHDCPGPTGGVGGDRLGRTHRAGRLQATGEHVHGDDLGPGERGQAGGEQADHALPEHRDLVAHPHVAGQHRVQRDGTDPGEGAGDRP